MQVSISKSGEGKLTIPFEPIDMMATNERASSFTKRSIKKNAKVQAINMAIEMIDLTTLEGMDTPGKVKQLCGKAKNVVSPEILKQFQDHPNFTELPQVACVCVYPNMVPYAKEVLDGTNINIASVATAFPSGQSPMEIKIRDVKSAIKYGANEIDMVIDRGAFLEGKYQKVFDEIMKIKDACEDQAHLKVILETGELKSFDKVQLASWLAMEAGADFIKTSTGKVQPAATMPVTLVMLQAIADYYDYTGKKIGMKPAGGIRTSKQAIHYLCMVKETLGEEWLTPDLFRFGASSLLNDLLKQLFKEYTGRYYYEDLFSLD